MSTDNGATGVNVGDAVATIQEFTYKRISTASGTDKSISGHRCILRAVVVNTTLANAVTLNDGGTGAFVIPAGVTAGSWIPFGDVGFKTNLGISHSATAGDLTFIFKSF